MKRAVQALLAVAFLVLAGLAIFSGRPARDAKDRIDLLCMPEIMLQYGMPHIESRLARMAVSVPGKKIEPFQRLAKSKRM